MDKIIWCCCQYEVPYRGVSPQNPSGHLLMALRNKGEKQLFKEPHATLFKYGSFSSVSSQMLLRGIMGISSWQLFFVPCINQNGMDSAMVVSMRQTLMRALQSTEPNFYQPWAAGLPGSIPLAKVDCILAVDRRQRVYRYDPITALWVHSVDGIKLSMTGTRPVKFKEIPHVPTRICFFNTDFSVFTFQLCMAQSTDLNSTEIRHLRQDSKLFTRRFISKLCSRISFIRRSSGLELAEEFCTLKTTISSRACKNQINQTYPLDLFNTCQLDDQIEQDHLNSSSYEMIFIRDLFDGHRFPVLSQCYKDYYCLDYGCWLLRAGSISSDQSLEDIFDLSSDFSQPSRQLFHITLHETSLETIYAEFETRENEPTNSDMRTNNSFSDLLSNFKQSSPAIWTEPKHSRSFSDTTPVHLIVPDHLSPDYVAPSLDINQFEMLWSTPKAKLIERAWLQLGNLVRLPQTFVPGIEVSLDHMNPNTDEFFDDSISTTTQSPLPDSPKSVSMDQLNLVNSPPTKLNDLKKMNQSWIDENFSNSNYKLISLGPTNLDRPVSQITNNPLYKRFSISKLLNPFSSSQKIVITDLPQTPPTPQPPTSPMNRSNSANPNKPVLSYPKRLNSIAAQCGPHRSDWYQYVKSTNWLDFIFIALKQASLLVELMRQLCFNQSTGYPGAYVVVTGPGSGRTWQCILMSLIQIMFSTEARTLKGFEDLIEREWVRYGYPFVPDPTSWRDSSIRPDYDNGASFALFIDCVHQLMVQFPTEFAFTEDYLVLLLDTALSRGGGLPPFAIEFACSCEAARTVCGTAKLQSQIQSDCESIYKNRACRSFRDWRDVLQTDGLRLLPNWCFWWQYSSDPLEIEKSQLVNEFSSSIKPSQILFPILSPPSYLKLWVHGWLRWLRALRLSTGGGYAFNASFYRQLLGPPCQTSGESRTSCLRPQTSASPYTGWMSDEAILNATSNPKPDWPRIHDPVFHELFKMASNWDSQDDCSYN